MRVYGIATCGSVKKATTFLKNKNIDFEFVDFKKYNPTIDEITRWSAKAGMDRLFNTKGTKYKTLGLDYKEMDEKTKAEWLSKEPLLIKRPVIEDGEKLIVGYDEKVYEESF
jgi:Spx/MgsR family transcriptional regulator